MSIDNLFCKLGIHIYQGDDHGCMNCTHIKLYKEQRMSDDTKTAIAIVISLISIALLISKVEGWL